MNYTVRNFIWIITSLEKSVLVLIKKKALMMII